MRSRCTGFGLCPKELLEFSSNKPVWQERYPSQKYFKTNFWENFRSQLNFVYLHLPLTLNINPLFLHFLNHGSSSVVEHHAWCQERAKLLSRLKRVWFILKIKERCKETKFICELYNFPSLLVWIDDRVPARTSHTKSKIYRTYHNNFQKILNLPKNQYFTSPTQIYGCSRSRKILFLGKIIA